MSEHHTTIRLADELRFTVALVSKVAILNPPDVLRLRLPSANGGSNEVVSWWQPAGNAWFQDICTHVRGYNLIRLSGKSNTQAPTGVVQLEINPENLPSEPGLLDAESLAGIISPKDHTNITSVLLTATIIPSPEAKDEAHKQASEAKASEKVARAFGYTAASRSILAYALSLLSIPASTLLDVEKTLGHELFEKLKETEMKEKSEAARKEQEDGWGGKWGRWAATGSGVIVGFILFQLNSFRFIYGGTSSLVA